MTFRRVATLRTAEQFRDYLVQLGANLASSCWLGEDFLGESLALAFESSGPGLMLPLDEKVETGSSAPLAQPYTVDGRSIGNRFSVLPMEGWDGTLDGRPTELTSRRWQRFGRSGAKLIWGGEAVAVRADGRANPNQLWLNKQTAPDLAALRQTLVTAHEEQHGRADDLLVGLQLTHSGRFSRPMPGVQLRPSILYPHPILNKKFGLPDDFPVMADDEIRILIDDFVKAAVLAQQIGFDFVDIKHCHGYLGHEFLSAIDRPGPYGGSFSNRTRFLREIVAGIRQHAPGLGIGVRLSAFDWVPFAPDETGIGQAMISGSYRYAFGGDGSGTGISLVEPIAFVHLLQQLDISLVCISAGSPYYVPHIQRPALFPPSDGYGPPEDPLIGVARQIAVTAALKQRFPNLALVGSGYSYLQEWLPHVAQAVVRLGMVDFVGLGRVMLSYPQLPTDVLAGNKLQRKLFCRTFSDCTTAPRHGLVSGCFPLDDFYKRRPEAAQLRAIKATKK
jgi:2,4-dienoyl-CoA reductase-like NADH-dependent reductase (Old Yellow Enzyme family)